MNCIARHLETARLTQKAFAELIGVSQPTVNDWVLGKKKPAGDNVIKIASAIGLEPIAVLADFHLHPDA